jgi:hypothetical protein
MLTRSIVCGLAGILEGRRVPFDAGASHSVRVCQIQYAVRELGFVHGALVDAS